MTTSKQIASLTKRRASSALTILALSCAYLYGAAFALTQSHAQEGTPQATAPAVNTPPDTARGIELYKQGKNREAAEVLRAAVKRRKDDAEAWLHLGIALARAGDGKEARKAFEKAARLSPDIPQAHIGMAYLSLESGKAEDAERAAARAVALDARNAEAHYALGLVHLRQSAAAKALAEAEETLKLNPTFAGAYLLKAEAAKEAYAAAYFERVDKYRKLDQPAPDMSMEERAQIASPLREAAVTLEKYLTLLPAAPDAARLREQAETLRSHYESVSRSGAPFIYRGDEVTTKAQILSKPEPLYTEKARQNGVTGTISLRMVFFFDGRVRNVVVLKGLGSGLTEMAVNAARRIKFAPATKDGRPVSQYVTIEYNFNIF